MTRLAPKDGIAIVTGGGSGLGRALARRLAAEGFTVAITGRRAAALAETASGHDAILPVTLDVSDAAAVTESLAGLARDHGPIALLINNAAVYPRRDFLEETAESFQHTVAINLGGTVACTRAALDSMVLTGRGRILNVSTFADLHPLPSSSAYAVSKGAARILTRALVADLADRFPGIVVSDWLPGMLKTTMGIPDGVPPETAAEWGVELALRCGQDYSGTIFEMNRELLPPRGLKGKMKDAFLLRTRRPRAL